MKITRIEKQNEVYFLPFLHESAREERPGVLRIGALLEDGTVVGAAAAQLSPAALDILSVYVLPEHRRKGYGTEMIEALCRIASEAGISSVSAESRFDVEIMDFLRNSGFSFFYDFMLCSVLLGVLSRSQKLENAAKQFASPNTHPLSKATSKEEKMIRHYLAARNIPTDGGIEKEYSVFTSSGENRITGITLLKAREGGLEFLWQELEDADPKEGLDHMVTILKLLDRSTEYDGSTRLFFSAEDERLPKLVAYFAGNESYIRREEIYMRGIRLM